MLEVRISNSHIQLPCGLLFPCLLALRFIPCLPWFPYILTSRPLQPMESTGRSLEGRSKIKSRLSLPPHSVSCGISSSKEDFSSASAPAALPISTGKSHLGSIFVMAPIVDSWYATLLCGSSSPKSGSHFLLWQTSDWKLLFFSFLYQKFNPLTKLSGSTLKTYPERN